MKIVECPRDAMQGLRDFYSYRKESRLPQYAFASRL